MLAWSKLVAESPVEKAPPRAKRKHFGLSCNGGETNVLDLEILSSSSSFRANAWSVTTIESVDLVLEIARFIRLDRRDTE
jgi:hypothetical protein